MFTSLFLFWRGLDQATDGLSPVQQQQRQRRQHLEGWGAERSTYQSGGLDPFSLLYCPPGRRSREIQL